MSRRRFTGECYLTVLLRQQLRAWSWTSLVSLRLVWRWPLSLTAQKSHFCRYQSMSSCPRNFTNTRVRRKCRDLNSETLRFGGEVTYGKAIAEQPFWAITAKWCAANGPRDRWCPRSHFRGQALLYWIQLMFQALEGNSVQDYGVCTQFLVNTRWKSVSCWKHVHVAMI